MLRYVCAIVTLLVMLSSCDKHEFSEFRPVEIPEANVSFDVRDNGFLLQTTIPCAGKTVSVFPECGGGRIPLVTSVIVDGVASAIPGSFEGEWPYLEEQPVLEGDWGRIYYDSAGDMFSVNIQLTENRSSAVRTVRIKLGYGYEYVDLEIVQEAGCAPDANL